MCLSVILLQTIVRADNYNVVNTSDSGPGSLRQAILDANAHPNIDANKPDTIRFAIPGLGVRTITPLTELPAISDPLVIDGYTQPGASPNTLAIGDNATILIELNGNGASFNGLTVTAGNSTVRGLVIDNFSGSGPGTGIWLSNNGGNRIEGCFIGTNPTGTAELNNQAGVLIADSLNNTVGGTPPAARNIILGNANPVINTQFASASTATGLIVQGNYVGTDVTGTKALGKSGIRLVASSNLIGGTDAGAGNIISIGSDAGIVLELAADGNTIQGNFVGVTADGSAALGSGSLAILLQRSSNNLIGGDTAAARNVIASIWLTGFGPGSPRPTQKNRIEGNYIGLNSAGTAVVPPSGRLGTGITIFSGFSDTIIGNVIAGCDTGVSILSTDALGTFGHRLQGNFIGTNAAGTEALPNRTGVSITSGGARPLDPVTSSNLIGGLVSGNGNVISGNFDFGVSIAGGSRNTVQGNLIGLAPDGISPLPNGKGGIFISAAGIYGGTGNGNQVGGKESGAGNVIAYNGVGNISQANGIQIVSGTGNAVLGNSIYANYGLGIDLGNYGPTPNDPGDGDSGANNLQNFPVIASVTKSGGNTAIAGMLNSVANTTYRIEFFANESQGQTFLGSTDVTTDANGNASFNFIAPQIDVSQYVTATATDPNGNTSEFSPAVGQPLNIATRLRVQTDDNVLIGGFIIAGTDPKRVIVRGIGPSLASAGVPDFLADPTLELHDASGATLETNDNWKTKSDGSSQQAEVEATTIPPTNDLEAAIVRTLPANGARYTAVLRGKNNTTGIGVVEAYDLDQAANSTLANISTRGLVETGNNVLIGGFIAGRGLTKVVIRAIGPTLASSGVANPLQDPTLELHDSSGVTIASNDNWKTKSDGSSQQAEIEATGIPPENDLESALVASLPPGNYTAIVRGKSNSTGVAVVEVYNLP